MKILVLGVTKQSGKAKSTGQPYEFTTVNVASPFQPFANENVKRSGHGFEPQTINGAADLVEKCAGLQWPAYYDLVTDTVFRNGEAEPVVLELRPVK